MFANRHYGETQDELLGTHGTVTRDEYDGTTFTPEGKGDQQSIQLTASNKAADNTSTAAHMQNFIDCVRSRKEPNCPFEIGYRSADLWRRFPASLRGFAHPPSLCLSMRYTI